MSVDNKAEDTTNMCAFCGIAGIDNVKLKDCSACHLVKYCGVNCQKEHRPKHKKACKKRAAELRDELLFKQPERSCYGDCPICCLPVPLDPSESIFTSCCSKSVCKGCSLANQDQEAERRLENMCAFCRTALPKTEEEINERLMKRIEANDPVALCRMGTDRYHEGDCRAAFEYWARAAALGNAMANFQLSCLYGNGECVEKDEKKYLHHTEQAAIGGHPNARHNLGCVEEENGRMDRAGKHYIIAAKLGFDDSLNCVKDMYKDGHLRKEDFAAALRGHKAAVDATMSPQREEAAGVFFKGYHWKVGIERGAA